MDQYYRIKPTVDAIQYTKETVKEIIDRFWGLGYFVKVLDDETLLVMLAYENDWTTIHPGSYLVFDHVKKFSIEFTRLNEEEFHQEYSMYKPKEN